MRNKARDDEIQLAAGHRGRYRLDRPLGASRFASLWAGEDTATGQRVVVEVIRATPPADLDDAKALRDRMAATQDLPSHPNLLAVRSIHAPEPPGKLAVASRAAARGRVRRGVEEQQWLLVLDPFDGATLDHRAAFGDLSTAGVCAIAAKVGEALQALHAVGVTHGSVSATSVLVSDDGDVRLIDAVVGSWGGAPTSSAPFADRCREDVVALARLVSDLLSPVAVPLGLRAVLRTTPSLEDLVARLREEGASVVRPLEPRATRAAEPQRIEAIVSAERPDRTAGGDVVPLALESSAVVIVPDAEPEAVPAHGLASEVAPVFSVGSVVPPAPDPVGVEAVRRPSPSVPDLPATSVPAPSGRGGRRESGTRRRELTLEQELEPAPWMKVAAVVASLAMFAGIGAALYYFAQAS